MKRNISTGRHDQEKAKRTFKRRTLLVAGIQGTAFALLTGRLWQLQLFESNRFKPLSEANRLRQEGVASRRGRILDRTGRLLASNAEYFQVYILPGDRARMRDTLNAVTRVLQLSSEDVERILTKANGAPRSRPILVRNGLTFEQIAEIGLLIPQLPGVQTETQMRRSYPYGPAACHVVGYVGSLQKKALDDDPLLRLPNVRLGKSGVELGMDTDLRGEAGSQQFEVNARGRVMRTLQESAPSSGKDEMVTIDANLQERVLQRLNSEVQASIVALDVRTGEIRVMVSIPTYDPNLLTMNFEEEAWKEVTSDKHLPLLNRAIGGNYPPGSTFKMITALAALEDGATTPDEQI
ncbi:MAG: penicillin-binding transpeptidase domain-containing protein, partial [Hyphomicrobium sp.]